MVTSTRLDPQQRFEALVDPGSWFEIASAARSQQPVVADRTPRDGVLTAFAAIEGHAVVVIVEDPVALEATDGEVARRKRHRMLNFALMTASPVVLVVDGPHAIRTRFEDNSGELAGRMSDPRLDVDLARRRAPLVCVLCGPAVGWARDVVAEADLVIATRNACDDLASTSRSSVDIVVDDDAAAMATARAVAELLGPEGRGNDAARFAPVALTTAQDAATVPQLMAEPRRVAELLVDDASFIEFHAAPESGLVTGLATIGRWPVLLAVTGGAESAVLTSVDLRRLAHLYRVGGRHNLPLVLVQDCAGYSNDAEEDLGALAELLAAIRGCGAPSIAIVSGRGHTLGTFALGTKQLGTAFIIAWPWAQLATSDTNSYLPEALDAVRHRDPWLAAGRGLVDDVLTPDETASTVRQLVALFGERWTPGDRSDRPNAANA